MRAQTQRAGRWTTRGRLLVGLLVIVALMTLDAAIIIGQQSLMERAFADLERANTIERYLLECRRQEKNFLLRRDAESLSLYEANMAALLAVTDELHRDVRDDETAGRLSALKKRVAAYHAAFEAARAEPPPADPDAGASDWPTVTAARVCHGLVQAIRDATISRFHQAQEVTGAVSVASVVLAVALSIGVAGFLTRSIVGPLERLRRLADQVGGGDIQDVDVELSDLDLGQFRSQESYDLARALQCMVTNIRFLVSSERGTMDEYHMTILVLVNRALGACRWAVVERARSAAGFGSFSEVDPSNVECFLAELEREARELVPEERVERLLRAIRALER